jgi:hypothetical protein
MVGARVTRLAAFNRFLTHQDIVEEGRGSRNGGARGRGALIDVPQSKG